MMQAEGSIAAPFLHMSHLQTSLSPDSRKCHSRCTRQRIEHQHLMVQPDLVLPCSMNAPPSAEILTIFFLTLVFAYCTLRSCDLFRTLNGDSSRVWHAALIDSSDVSSKTGTFEPAASNDGDEDS